MHKLSLTLILIPLLTGCANISGTQATALNQTITTASQNLGTSLTNAQNLDLQTQILSQAIIDPAAGNSDDPESIDLTLISDDTKKALLSQFDALAQYSALLAKITAGQTSFATSVGGVNSALNQASTDASALAQTTTGKPLLTPAQAKSIPGDISTISGAFATIGQTAINLYADHQAYTIAKKANPGVQKYCTLLQQTLCIDPDKLPQTGLNGIVWNAYNTRVDDLEILYKSSVALKAPPLKKPDSENDEDFINDRYRYVSRVQQRAALLTQIAQVRQQWQQDNAAILALRKTIGQIAQAHQALVDKKKESFLNEISAAITTLKNVAGYYKAGSTSSSASSAPKPNGSSPTPSIPTTPNSH